MIITTNTKSIQLYEGDIVIYDKKTHIYRFTEYKNDDGTPLTLSRKTAHKMLKSGELLKSKHTEKFIFYRVRIAHIQYK